MTRRYMIFQLEKLTCALRKALFEHFLTHIKSLLFVTVAVAVLHSSSCGLPGTLKEALK